MLSTTELFVEHIISGILSLLWILLVIFCITGIDPTLLPVIKELWGLFAVVTTAIAYPIGIFVDTIADKLLEKWNQKIKASHGLPADFSLLIFLHENKDDNNLLSYFTYNRFKTRVARSSFINFMMIGIVGAAFVLVQGSTFGFMQTGKLGAIVFITFILLAGTALYLWKEIAETVYQRAAGLSRA
jgi:hypothetical protein